MKIILTAMLAIVLMTEAASARHYDRGHGYGCSRLLSAPLPIL